MTISTNHLLILLPRIVTILHPSFFAISKSVQKFDTNQNIAEFLKNASIGDQQKLVEQLYPQKPRTDYSKRRLGDLMIDFGIDIASRTPTGSGISGAISTALAAAKDPFERFKASRANEELLKALTTYAEGIGLAFQIIDDILDLTSSSEKLGKTAGKDLLADKTTYPKLLGMEESKKKAFDLVDQAKKAIEPWGLNAKYLISLADFITNRDR